jgi:hypothetical protein
MSSCAEELEGWILESRSARSYAAGELGGATNGSGSVLSKLANDPHANRAMFLFTP